MFTRKQKWVREASLLKRARLAKLQQEKLATKQQLIAVELSSTIESLKKDYMCVVEIEFEENISSLRKMGLQVVRPITNLLFGTIPKWKVFIPYE